MVQSKTAKTQTPARRRAASTRSARPKSKPELVIDPELLSDEFNQTHRPRLPNGVVINDKPAGLFLPLAQLEQAEWKTLPDADELTSTEITGEEIGLFLTEARLLVLTFVPTYIRYKSDTGATGQVIGRYEDHRAKLDKKLMDVVSEHAIVFLDDANQPLHDIPFTIRFKNVALWSFIELREKAYRQLEKAVSQVTHRRYQGKNQQWRSLGVLHVGFKAQKEGEARNKSDCCKSELLTPITVDNLSQMFLASTEAKETIWDFHALIAGFDETPASPGQTNRPLQSIQPTETTEDISEELETIDELDDIDIAAPVANGLDENLDFLDPDEDGELF